MAVPLAEWITLEMVVEDSDFCKTLHVHEDLQEKLSHPWRNCFFTLFIAEQKMLGDKSKYKPFLDSLPLNVSNFPVMFGEEERVWLQGSSLLEKVDERVETW